VYDREYDGRELNFEASGGLLHAALVMQDKETDSYWSIMTADSIAGNFKGTSLKELPGSTKTQWKLWVKLHPDTLVLSVNGREHIENNPYDNYFSSDDGFSDFRATDSRLSTKTPIYAFHHQGKQYAVPFRRFRRNGASFSVSGGLKIFLYRPRKVAIFHSTEAFMTEGEGFVRENGVWKEIDSGAAFDPQIGVFVGASDAVRRLRGFDTFWYNWSLTHPETEVLP